MYLWETSFGYARRRCVEYFTRLECFAAPIHRLFSLTRSRIHRNVCSPAVVTKFWMCKEVCSFCPRALFKRIDITSIEIYMAFNHRTIHDEQHVSIYIDYFFNSLFERSRKNHEWNSFINTWLQSYGQKSVNFETRISKEIKFQEISHKYIK